MLTSEDIERLPLHLQLIASAFPAGFLPMRGASTVGGYTCVFVRLGEDRPTIAWSNVDNPRCSILTNGAGRWREYDANGNDATRAPDRPPSDGLLLPNLDPDGDPATWACALAWLARRSYAGKPPPYNTPPNVGALLWSRKPYHFGHVWSLHGAFYTENGEPRIEILTSFGPFSPDTTDPVVALCYALIELEGRARAGIEDSPPPPAAPDGPHMIKAPLPPWLSAYDTPEGRATLATLARENPPPAWVRDPMQARTRAISPEPEGTPPTPHAPGTIEGLRAMAAARPGTPAEIQRTIRYAGPVEDVARTFARSLGAGVTRVGPLTITITDDFGAMTGTAGGGEGEE